MTVDISLNVGSMHGRGEGPDPVDACWAATGDFGFCDDTTVDTTSGLCKRHHDSTVVRERPFDTARPVGTVVP